MIRKLFVLLLTVYFVFGKYIDKRKCPEVRAVPHFDLSQVKNFRLFLIFFINFLEREVQCLAVLPMFLLILKEFANRECIIFFNKKFRNKINLQQLSSHS